MFETIKKMVAHKLRWKRQLFSYNKQNINWPQYVRRSERTVHFWYIFEIYFLVSNMFLSPFLLNVFRYLKELMGQYNDSVDELMTYLKQKADGKTEILMAQQFNKVSLDIIAKVRNIDTIVSCT